MTFDTEGPQYVDNRIEFRLSRKEPSQNLLWLAGGLGVGLLWAAFTGKIDTTYVLIYVGMFAVFYGLSWYDETNAEMDRQPKLTIGANGIEIPDRFRTTIPWEDIEKISTHTHKGSTTLHIVPVDPAAHGIEVKSGWSKFWTGDGVSYDITPLEGDTSDVHAAIRRFAPERLRGDF